MAKEHALNWGRVVISESTAKALARAVGRPLPRHGMEVRVEYEGNLWWMRRSEHSDERAVGSWVLHGSSRPRSWNDPVGPWMPPTKNPGRYQGDAKLVSLLDQSLPSYAIVRGTTHRNDACASIEVEQGDRRVKIFIDSEDADDRENVGIERYVVEVMDGADLAGDVLVATDDRDAVVAAVVDFMNSGVRRNGHEMIPDDVRLQLVDMQIESLDGSKKAREEAEVSPMLRDRFDEWEWVALDAIKQIAETEEAAEEVVARGGVYLMLMTQMGHGVGVWDGTLDGIPGFSAEKMNAALKKPHQHGRVFSDLRKHFVILEGAIHIAAQKAMEKAGDYDDR